MRTLFLIAALFLTACPADDAPDQADAGSDPNADAAPASSLRACESWRDCLGEPLPDGRRLDIGECCASQQYSGVCVLGRMTGGEANNPDNPFPGDPHGGVCLADTTAAPLPAEQCEHRQSADDLIEYADCATDDDCEIYDGADLVFRGCCAVDVGKCVKGTSRDYYGRPAVCALRTDFAAPEELCNP